MAGIINVGLLILTELINPYNIKFTLYGIIPALAGFYSGVKLKNRISELRFRKATLFIIILIGLIGLFKIILGITLN